MADDITRLQPDNTSPSSKETILIEEIFKSPTVSTGDKNRYLITLGVLFILFNLPFIDDGIKAHLPIAGTYPYLLLVVKAVLFCVAVFIVLNIGLMKI